LKRDISTWRRWLRQANVVVGRLLAWLHVGALASLFVHWYCPALLWCLFSFRRLPININEEGRKSATSKPPFWVVPGTKNSMPVHVSPFINCSVQSFPLTFFRSLITPSHEVKRRIVGGTPRTSGWPNPLPHVVKSGDSSLLSSSGMHVYGSGFDTRAAANRSVVLSLIFRDNGDLNFRSRDRLLFFSQRKSNQTYDTSC